jgi:hypothetical protein
MLIYQWVFLEKLDLDLVGGLGFETPHQAPVLCRFADSFRNSFAGHQFSRTNSRLGLVWKSATTPKKSWLIRWSIIFPSFSHHFSLKNRPFYGHSYGSTPRNSAGIFLGPISDRQQLPSPDGPSGRGCWDWILEDPLVHQEVWLGAHLVEGLPGLPSGKLT